MNKRKSNLISKNTGNFKLFATNDRIFVQVNNFTDFWDYLSNIVISSLLSQQLEVYISRRSLNSSRNVIYNFSKAVSSSDSTLYNLVGNKTYRYALNLTVADGVGYLLAARLRQLRMPAKSCQLPAYLLHYFAHCIGEYYSAEEDANSYPVGWNPSAIPYLYAATVQENGEFVYKSAQMLDGVAEQMTLSTYNGGGYIGDLGISFASGINELVKLISSQWIDLQTRNVIVEHIFYNPTTQLYSSVQIAFEFFAGGSIITWSQFSTIRIDKYSGPNGIWIITFQLLSLIFIIYFVFSVTVAIIKERVYFLLV